MQSRCIVTVFIREKNYNSCVCKIFFKENITGKFDHLFSYHRNIHHKSILKVLENLKLFFKPMK